METHTAALMLIVSLFVYRTFFVREIKVDAETVVVLLWDEISSHAGALKLFNVRNIERTCHNTHSSFALNTPCEWVKIPNCPVDCVLSRDRSLISKAKVVFFHPDRIWRKNVPLEDYMPTEEKPPGQMYALFGHEPTFKKPWFWLSPNFTRHFDIAFHWGHGADVQLQFYYLDELHYGYDPGNWWEWADVEKWRKLLPAQVLRAKNLQDRVPERDALASVLVSNCESRQRNRFLTVFMTNFPTVSFGRCLNNAEGDSGRPNGTFAEKYNKSDAWYMNIEHGDFRDSSVSIMEQKVEMISHYPFHFAIESTRRERGFITEKIFQSFLAGVVPLYYGHAEVLRYLPPNSFIYLNSFDSAESASTFIKTVALNTTKYMEFHQWRSLPNVSAYFEPYKERSRGNAACRLCQFWKDSNGEIPPGLLRYKRKFGWFRTTLDAPTDMTDFNSYDPPLKAKYVPPSEVDRVDIPTLTSYLAKMGTLSMEDSDSEQKDKDDD